MPAWWKRLWDACRSRWRIRPGSGRQELRRNWRIVVRSYEIARIAIIAGIAKIENLDSSILAIPAIMAISRLGLRYNHASDPDHHRILPLRSRARPLGGREGDSGCDAGRGGRRRRGP